MSPGKGHRASIYPSSSSVETPLSSVSAPSSAAPPVTSVGGSSIRARWRQSRAFDRPPCVRQARLVREFPCVESPRIGCDKPLRWRLIWCQRPVCGRARTMLHLVSNCDVESKAIIAGDGWPATNRNSVVALCRRPLSSLRTTRVRRKEGARTTC